MRSSLLQMRTQVLGAAWWPTARSISWRGPLSAASLAATIIVHQRLAQPSAEAGSFTIRAQLAAALAAAAAAIVLDDPAARLVDTSPTTRAWRTGARLTLGLAAWAATWALTLTLIASAPGSPPVTELTRQALVLLALAIGVAANSNPTAGAATVGLVAVSALVVPDRWSILSGDPAANWRLGLLGLAGVVALAVASRDQARRRRSPRSLLA